ncbi:interleukin-6 receptor subunit beta isoform X1 [Pseudochaenichthys georgianus]|uniref:interleukin-6 receptor subunit beta isoform X1 n=1 Tax=Pseudochaenichthys georgianus TaxID=52239 RepID=UPI00146A6885|nr:interleukin-6 receptor subunit beta isoform X1 [Pseudochaenichthys georgianus]
MVSAGELLLLAGLVLAAAATGGFYQTNHLVTAPQTTQFLEIGSNFKATCMIVNTTEVTADDLYWKLSETTVSKELYTKLNESAISVTVPVTSVQSEWLFCRAKKGKSPYVFLNTGKFMYGVLLKKGYPPGKPENVFCVAVQEKTTISSTFRCDWATVGRQTSDVPTKYTLNVVVIHIRNYSVSTEGTHAQVEFVDTYPHFMTLEIWVEAHNMLGKIESERITQDANSFVKTNPPSDIKVISEKYFPTSPLMNWTQPINKSYGKLKYEIRFCTSGSPNWTYVPKGDIATDIQSFRLQSLQPYTEYITQVRCQLGHWSDWSGTTMKTAEDRPTSKPDLWRTIAEVDGKNERRVQFISKDPVFANGRIITFDIKIQEQKNDNLQWDTILVNGSESSDGQRVITVLKDMLLADLRPVRLCVTANNSVGTSPMASLFISAKGREDSPVKGLKVWSAEGKLWLQWTPPNGPDLSEYVVEWVSGEQTDWQRENKNTRLTAIKGNLEGFVRYTVSVYSIYSGRIGKPASKEAYLKEGAPLEGPVVRLNDKPGRNEAELGWVEIPLHRQRGFIVNYTINYTGGGETHEVTVPGNTVSYTLKSLSSNTKYDTWINASTVRGSAQSSTHSFTTLKYAPGEVESIVVGVSLGFMFVVLMTMLLCLYKKDVIKENLWPRIPDPGESTIGNWSPDYPLKAETLKENCLSGISVLDVDVCDGKSVFEEDKACLPLKKDKYLSEEHSSGIGGSSCMSSPRQSVSDSDEGSDMADTTASTVQYSSVVASNGYKGQTPNPHPQQAVFSRSESTQPLLDSEENPDMVIQESSRQSQRFKQENPAEIHLLEMDQQQQEGGVESLGFCPRDEESEQTKPSEGQSAASSYMSQREGYRPQ